MSDLGARGDQSRPLDFAGKSEGLVKEGVFEQGVLSLKSFAKALERTLGDPTRGAGFLENHVAPFGEKRLLQS